MLDPTDQPREASPPPPPMPNLSAFAPITRKPAAPAQLKPPKQPSSSSLAVPTPQTRSISSPSLLGSAKKSVTPASPARTKSPVVPTSPAPQDPDGWDDTDNAWKGDEPGSPANGSAAGAAPLAGLSKEDKAAEMARRREERKQVSVLNAAYWSGWAANTTPLSASRSSRSRKRLVASDTYSSSEVIFKELGYFWIYTYGVGGFLLILCESVRVDPNQACEVGGRRVFDLWGVGSACRPLNCRRSSNLRTQAYLSITNSEVDLPKRLIMRRTLGQLTITLATAEVKCASQTLMSGSSGFVRRTSPSVCHDVSLGRQVLEDFDNF